MLLIYSLAVASRFLPVPCVTGGGRVERRCWVNFQCRGVLLLRMIVGQGPIVLAVEADGGCLDIFSLVYLFSFLPLFRGGGVVGWSEGAG